jgi:hypothetical protein
MKRRVFTMLTALSLLLCVAVCVLWVRSFWSNDRTARFEASGRRWWVSSNDSGLHVVNQLLGEVHGPPLGQVRKQFLCFRYQCGLFADGTNPSWSVPHWPPAVVLLVLSRPLLVPVRSSWQRRSRLQAGHCPSCGYDLRATPERCPECGISPTP